MNDSPVENGNLISKTTPDSPVMSTHKQTEEDTKSAQSAQALLKLKQAQKKLEWQKKRQQSKAESEGVAKDNNIVQDGYDLNELVSEGQYTLSPLTHTHTHSLARSLAHSLTHSPTHPHTHTHTLTYRCS